MKKQSKYFVACLLFLVLVNKTKAQSCPSVTTLGTGTVTANAQGIYATDKADIRLFPSCNAQSEVSISVDKNNPCYLVASSNILNTTAQIEDQAYYYSIDGGETWYGTETYPSLSTYNTGATPPWSPDDGDPSTAFDGRGYGFISTMENTYYSNPSYDNHNGFYLVSSQDNGATPWASSPLPTWSNPATATSGVVTSTDGFDRPTIAVDDEPNSPYYNYVYTVGTEFTSTDCSSGSTGNLRFFKSINNGTGFPTTYNVTDLRNSSTGFGWGANVQTGPNGEVYVAWAEHPTGTYPASNIGFAVSINGGATWTHTNTVLSTTIAVGAVYPQYNGGVDFDCGATHQSDLTGGPNGLLVGISCSCYTALGLANDGTGYIKMTDYVAMAVDKSCGNYRGRIYIVYTTPDPGAPNTAIIQVSYSDDNGTTWVFSNNSQPVNITTTVIGGSFFPWIAVDDVTGIVSVIYYSQDGSDNNFGNATNTYVAYSSDGSQTFTNIKISDVPHLTAPIIDYANTGTSDVFMGDYIGITAHNGKAYAAWMDNRINSPESPSHNKTFLSTWQIYVSEIDYSIPDAYTAQNDNLNVAGPISIAAPAAPIPPQIYEAQNEVVVPSTSAFASASGSNVIIRAGYEVNLTNNFSAQNEMHAYIQSPLTCFNAICNGGGGRLSASNATGTAPIAEPVKEVVVATKLGANTKLSIYPNPSSGLVYLNLSAQTEGNIFVNITTLSGDQILRTSYSATEGANNFKVDLSGLTQGVYFIKITDENGTTIKNDKLMLMGQ
jgi:hypothetical protein